MIRILVMLGALTLASCSILPNDVSVSVKPIEKQEIALPSADSVSLRDIEWIIITPENADEVFDYLKKTGKSLSLFSITSEDYEDMALNLSEIQIYIIQQKAIIEAYENYYKKQNK